MASHFRVHKIYIEFICLCKPNLFQSHDHEFKKITEEENRSEEQRHMRKANLFVHK